VADRDIEIGRLQATAESLSNQSADQFKRIDTLEVGVATLKAEVVFLDERLDAIGAPSPQRPLPDAMYNWKLWAALIALIGILAGAWSFQDIRAILLPVPG
jgi:hypothetical protein